MTAMLEQTFTDEQEAAIQAIVDLVRRGLGDEVKEIFDGN